MATNYKRVLWYERIKNAKYKVKPRFEKTELQSFVRKSEFNDNIGRVVSSTELQVLDTSKSLAKFKVSDFAIENLESIGYTADSVVKLSGNHIDSISNMEKQFESMENANKVNNNNNNNNNPNNE